MTDLSAAEWKEIEAGALKIQWVAAKGIDDGGLYIKLGNLRNILRKSHRTSEQNALLWALYADAIEKGGEALGGWTKDDVHEYMLGEFFGWDKREAFGRTRLKPKKRSSRLTKTQFSEFVEFIVRRFAEHGVVLELPGDLLNGGSDEGNQ